MHVMHANTTHCNRVNSKPMHCSKRECLSYRSGALRLTHWLRGCSKRSAGLLMLGMYTIYKALYSLHLIEVVHAYATIVYVTNVVAVHCVVWVRLGVYAMTLVCIAHDRLVYRSRVCTATRFRCMNTLSEHADMRTSTSSTLASLKLVSTPCTSALFTCIHTYTPERRQRRQQ
jgi:hypothetical protein